MGRVKNVTTKNVLAKKLIKVTITVNKGLAKAKKFSRRKQETYIGFGDDLQNRLRINAPSDVIKKLKKCYPQHQIIDQQNIIVDEINIVVAFSDPDKVFSSEMVIFKGSKIQQTCDGETINAKWTTDNDGKQTKFLCNEPCKKGDKQKCPLGCELSGIFYFDILELLCDGWQDKARLVVGTIEDNQFIQKFIDDLAESIPINNQSNELKESIRASPIISQEFKSYRPLILSKRSEYNTHYKRDYWYIDLKIHPQWLTRYQAHQLKKQAKLLNMQPSEQLLEQVYGEGFMRQITQVHNELPPAEPWVMDREKAIELQQIWRSHNWDSASLNQMFYKYFKIKNLSELQKLNEQQFKLLKVYLADRQIIGEFIF